MKTALLAITFASCCFAQSALVVPLKPEDAAKVQRLHQQVLDAEKAWTDAQKQIKERYLIVEKGDPDASDDHWYPPAKMPDGTFSTTYIGSGSFITTTGLSYLSSENACDPKKVAEHQAWEAEQKKLEQAREANSRRWRKGWYPNHNCSGCDPLPFEYSEDFKYLVPKPTPAEKPLLNSQWTFTN